SMLGMQPAAGRLLLPREGAVAGADPVIVLGYKYWQTHFGADRGIIGQTVEVDGHPITVVGVAPAGFRGTFAMADSDAYMPLAMAETTEPFAFTPSFMTDRNQRFLFVMGRLRRGMSLGRAQAALALVGDRLAQAYPKTDRGMVIAAYHETDARPVPDPNRTFQKISALFLALAGLVLLLACANVANLLLVRATGRVRELAVRAALGASRLRLIRQMLLESVLLGLGGGAAGLLVGMWASHALAGLNFQTSLPVALDFGLDWRVFAYGLGAAVASGIIAGVVPALRASRMDLERVLHAGGRGVSGGRSWLRSTLVVGQVAGSLALLIIACLFVRSLERAQNAHLGFDPHQVMNVSVDPNQVGLNEAQGRAFYRTVLERVRRLPGVIAAGAAFGVPMGYLQNA
ncbi:MAG: FtsX-like permease family protein, partial [Streptosporangiaceae bacterium]